MPRQPLRDVGAPGARRLRHLVILAPARIVRAVEKLPAEALGAQLCDVGENPGIKTEMTDGTAKHEEPPFGFFERIERIEKFD